MGCNRHRGRAARLVVFTTAAAAVLGSQELGYDALTFRGSRIVSGRPLADIHEMLQSRYGKVVTYEDPAWEWRGDFKDPSVAPGQPNSRDGVPRTVNLPAGLSPDQAPALDAALIRRVLDAYNSENDAPRFRVYASQLGLHVIPEFVRDEGGRVVPANNPLDAAVTIPFATRTVSAHLAALCAAVNLVAGRKIECGTMSLGNDGDWFERLFAAPGGELDLPHPSSPGPWIFWKGGAFEWGAGGLTARDALIDLLARSATTFSWEFRCSSPWSGDRVCTWTVERIRVAKSSERGAARIETLEYDRCSQRVAGCPSVPVR